MQTLLEHLQDYRETAAADAGCPLTSPEKLVILIAGLSTYRPRGPIEAGVSLLLRPQLHKLLDAIPEDPYVVDALLAQAAAQLGEVLPALQSDPGSLPEPEAIAPPEDA